MTNMAKLDSPAKAQEAWVASLPKTSFLTSLAAVVDVAVVPQVLAVVKMSHTD